MTARNCLLIAIPATVLVLGADDANQHDARRLADQESLTPLQGLVGQWRGVGQPQRGSNRGAWIEESDWAWRFDGDSASLAFTAPESKVLASGELAPDEDEGEFALTAKTAEGQTVRYVGRRNEQGELVLEAEAAPENLPARITIRLVAEGKRLVVLYERRGTSDRLVRLAEVGYTRKGSGFGEGATQIECIVTGGLGTIPVTHNGKTYYVCCTGCRDLFNDDPDGVLTEYRQRKAAERKKAN